MSETKDPARIVADEATGEQAKARRVLDADELAMAATDDACYLIGRTEYSRIRYGDETRGGGNWHISSRTGQPQPCGDCAVPVGAYHIPGCDVEECPRCHGQSISCDCDEETLRELQQEYRRLRDERPNARLLAEVARLREIARHVEADNAALREIAQAVADAQLVATHPHFGETTYRITEDGHLQKRARALLAKEDGGHE